LQHLFQYAPPSVDPKPRPLLFSPVIAFIVFTRYCFHASRMHAVLKAACMNVFSQHLSCEHLPFDSMHAMGTRQRTEGEGRLPARARACSPGGTYGSSCSCPSSYSSATSGGVTLKRRCTYRPSVIYLIVNKLLSLSPTAERAFALCRAVDDLRSILLDEVEVRGLDVRGQKILPHRLIGRSYTRHSLLGIKFVRASSS
jgi:hypothetical protein